MPATAELFRRFPNPALIESGTWHGDGIAAALEAGFAQVISIELSQTLFDQACWRFAKESRVMLLHGPSEDVLPMVLDDLQTPATFWLDAHYSGGDTARGEQTTPILQELALIAQHRIKTHTLLIDDLRLFGTEFPVSTEQLLDAVLAVNPDYMLSFADSQAAPKDVLIATP